LFIYSQKLGDHILTLTLQQQFLILFLAITIICLFFIIKRLFFGQAELPPIPETGISGTALYSDNTTPLVDADVMITDLDGNPLGAGKTGVDGGFKITGLPAGEGDGVQIIFNGNVVFNIGNVSIVQGEINNIGAIQTSRKLSLF
jgi:hypothetical protein